MFYKRDRGFTLVEILLAAILGALVVVVALAMFNRVSQSRSMMTYYSEVGAHGRYGLNRIRTDIANFYRNVEPDKMKLEGIKAVRDGFAADRLIMYVVSDEQERAGEPESDIYEVEYRLCRDRSNNKLFLGRRCGAVKEERSGNAGGVLVPIADYISALTFEYSENGRDWFNQWQNPNKLPRLVRVSMTLSDPAGRRPDLVISQEMSLEPLPVVTFSRQDTQPPSDPVIKTE
ncbi:MAG: prepilin-type N-terminal cleavage/methylation domain-containing protein [Sedimentisphaerales bacterium]|nr:prepilin-type N-terminal cleavage/methylation domain-containing protein [Sedimentisphaerales bacterium]